MILPRWRGRFCGRTGNDFMNRCPMPICGGRGFAALPQRGQGSRRGRQHNAVIPSCVPERKSPAWGQGNFFHAVARRYRLKVNRRNELFCWLSRTLIKRKLLSPLLAMRKLTRTAKNTRSSASMLLRV
jgi:hypothetical protein